MTPEEFTKFISVDNTSGRLPALVCRYGEDIRRFLTEYCAEAQKNGAIIAGGLANPTPEQLKYYTEMAGQDFRMDAEFFQCVIGKLLPGCKANKKERLAEAMLGMFTKLQKEGKNCRCIKKHIREIHVLDVLPPWKFDGTEWECLRGFVRGRAFHLRISVFAGIVPCRM